MKFALSRWDEIGRSPPPSEVEGRSSLPAIEAPHLHAEKLLDPSRVFDECDARLRVGSARHFAPDDEALESLVRVLGGEVEGLDGPGGRDQLFARHGEVVEEVSKQDVAPLAPAHRVHRREQAVTRLEGQREILLGRLGRRGVLLGRGRGGGRPPHLRVTRWPRGEDIRPLFGSICGSKRKSVSK